MEQISAQFPSNEVDTTVKIMNKKILKGYCKNTHILKQTHHQKVCLFFPILKSIKGSVVLSYCHRQEWRMDRLMDLHQICELQKQCLQRVPPPECQLVQQLALHLGHLDLILLHAVPHLPRGHVPQHNEQRQRLG